MRILATAIVLLSCSAAPAAEPMVTEVISVGYRDAGEVADLLKPLVPPPGTVTGISNQIVVKTTRENLREIRALLAQIDKAPVNLLISVRQELDEEVRRDLAEAGIAVESGGVRASAGARDPSGGGASASARVIREDSGAHSSAEQRVRVLEGATAFISAGESRPMRQRNTVVQDGRVIVQESVTFAEAGSGFYVRPRLSGERVILEVVSGLKRFDGGRIETREAQTRVSGRLGRWIAVAASAESGTRSASGIGRGATRRQSAAYTVYLKVTKLRD